MTDKEIKKVSKQLIRREKRHSMLILVFSIISIIFFSAIPYSLNLISNYFEIKTFFDQINIYIYPALISIVFIILTVWAISFYSSVSLGERAWYSGKAMSKKNSGKRLCFWFKPSSSLKAIKFSVLLFIIKSLWTIILLLPSIFFFASAFVLAYSGGIEVYLFLSLTAGGILLAVVGILFRGIILQRYFLAKYLIASNPKLGAMQSIKQSKNLLEGHIFRIVRFKLSFLPWFFLSLLIVPIFFTYPYYKQSCSVIAKEICL